MVKMDNYLGEIVVSNTYFANLVGYIATETFGVAGLVHSAPTQGLRAFFSKKEIPDKGVRVQACDGEITVDLYITVTYGVNISVIVKSIANKVAYILHSVSDLTVAKVNVYVAGMQVSE